MKKIHKILISILIILSMTIPMSSTAIDPKYETVKIGIYYGSSAKDSVQITSDAGFNVGYMDGGNFIHLYSFGESSLSVAPTGNSATINVAGSVYDINGGNYAFAPINGIVKINGAPYRGGVEFIPDSNGKLTVINFVNINDYIAGVVGKEMSSSWPIEALKAQAVCARSFTITTWNKHSHQGFNLCGTQDCQAYLGMSGESESTRRAAAETRDQVVKYGSKIVETLYSSSHGGSSAYSKYVWGSELPYLTAVEDNFEANTGNPYETWTVVLTKADIEAKLKAKSINIGEVVDFKVTGADEFGRTYEVTIYGSNGTYVIKNDKTRTFFGLKSQKYRITPSNAAPAGPVQKEVEFSIVPNEYAYASGVFVDALGAFHNQTSGASFWNSGSSTANQNPTPESVAQYYTLTGHGWGHGLGMSQYGAKGMANLGYDYVAIIEHYYKGAKVSY